MSELRMSRTPASPTRPLPQPYRALPPTPPYRHRVIQPYRSLPPTPPPNRHRVIQPMGMSPRGQLTSLQDAMCETMEGQLSSDPDSDPD